MKIELIKEWHGYGGTAKHNNRKLCFVAIGKSNRVESLKEF